MSYITIAIVLAAFVRFLLFVARKMFPDWWKESDLRKKRPAMLRLVVEKLEKARDTCKPANNDKQGAREFIYDLGDNMFVRHEHHPQEHAIIMWDVNGTHVDMRVRDGNIKDHLAVTDDERRHARRILMIMKIEEKKYGVI